MNTLRRLVEFEYSRFILYVPGSSKDGIRAAITYFVFLIAGAFYLFRNHDTPEVVFAIGVALSWGIMMNLPMFHIMMIWAQPQREWWLSFPHPRLTLVIAKVIGLVRVGVRIITLILLACLIYYGLAVSLGMMNQQPIGKIILLAGASLLLAGSMIPVAVVLGLTLSMMYSGWARWLLIPYIIIIQSPYVLLGLSMEAAALRYLSPSYMLLYTLGIVVIGWPLAYILMRGIAGIGMKNMADVRLRMKSTATYKGVEDTKEVKVRIVGERSRFATLYLLERSRYRYYGSILAVRIIKYSLLIIIAAGAYFSSGYQTAVLEMLQVIFMLPVLAASIYTMNRSSIDRKHLQWWLGYPVSRSLLLLSQLAGVWVTTMRVIGTISVVIWAGIAVGLITGRMEWQDVSLSLEWFVYSLVLYTTILTFAMGILQSSYYLMKSTVMSLFLVFPQYLLVAFQSMVINEYLYPDNFNSSIQTPEWSTLGILLALALPISAFCIHLGVRSVHLSLGNVSKPLWKSQ